MGLNAVGSTPSARAAPQFSLKYPPKMLLYNHLQLFSPPLNQFRFQVTIIVMTLKKINEGKKGIKSETTRNQVPRSITYLTQVMSAEKKALMVLNMKHCGKK